MKKTRKNYTPEEKVAILRRHLLEREPISKLCEELRLQPTISYRWQKEFFENGAAAFQGKARARQLPSGQWTSKIGRYEDIVHETLSALEGPAYGSPKVVMKRSRFVNP